MDFLKQHWRKIVFGLVCAASLGLGAWGVLAGDSIRERMQIPEQLRSKLASFAATGVNPRMIAARKDELKKVQESLEAAIKLGRDLQVYNAFYEQRTPTGVERKKREPLLTGVLPTLERPSRAFEFKTAYVDEFAKLTDRLHAKEPPDRADFEAKKRELAARGEGQKRQAAEPWSLLETGGGMESLMARGSRQKLNRVDVLRNHPEVLASLERAKTAWMYVDRDSLGIHQLVNSESPASVDQIWQAQMSLWIQQDIVTAIARVNDAAVEELRKNQQADRVWVAYLPIKHLVRLSIHNRLGRGGGSNTLGAQWSDSFTGRRNNASFFVVPLQMRIVLDARAIPRLLDALARVNFYTPINMTYERVDPNFAQIGYVYGSQPVVALTLDLEGYYFRDVFDPWIPAELKPILATPDAKEKDTSRGRG
ncbi:MAG: hypothetical protein L6Q92_03015 [Phycisphaerae bacterium]|nr:hypothetical protein [Phycisphaerae bacterium]